MDRTVTSIGFGLIFSLLLGANGLLAAQMTSSILGQLRSAVIQGCMSSSATAIATEQCLLESAAPALTKWKLYLDSRISTLENFLPDV